MNLADELADLESIEEFFILLNVDYDEDLIKKNRIQLLKLFHKALEEHQAPVEFLQYQAALSKAYCLFKHGVSVPLAESNCSTCNTDCSTESV